MGKGIIGFFKFIFSKNEKPNDILGYYDVKQFHSLKYALIYAKNEPVEEAEVYDIYSRVYKGITLVNVLVYDENMFIKENFKYDNLKDKILKVGLEATNESIVIIVFQNKNDKTISICKSLVGSGKRGFIQGLVYDEVRVTLDYYISVPDFYTKLNEAYCEAIYFDFAAIDPSRE